MYRIPTGGRTVVGAALHLAAAAALMAVPDTVSAQPLSGNAPPNSHSHPYGRGWECDWGYREDDGLCIAIEVPANAFVSPLGISWECRRGFRQANDACVAIEVPENG